MKAKNIQIDPQDLSVGDIVINLFGNIYYIHERTETIIHKHDCVKVEFLRDGDTKTFIISDYRTGKLNVVRIE